MLSWLPERVSTYAGEIDSIFSLIFYIVSGWFVLTFGVLVYSLVRFRRREGHRARYLTGHTLAQGAWILVPAVVVLGMDFWIDIQGAKVWEAVQGRGVPGEVKVQVTAKQFNWEVLYPGPDGVFGTADDLRMDNDLHVPVNKVVELSIRSKDVIHALFVPSFRIKQDILPGREGRIWFKATKPGRYEMPCAELCGFGHSGMRGWVIVHSGEDYDRWVRERWRSARVGVGSEVSGLAQDRREGER